MVFERRKAWMRSSIGAGLGSSSILALTCEIVLATLMAGKTNPTRRRIDLGKKLESAHGIREHGTRESELGIRAKFRLSGYTDPTPLGSRISPETRIAPSPVSRIPIRIPSC